MKTLPTKAQIRREIEQQMQDYLARGGKVVSVAQGVSGRADALAQNHRPFVEPSREGRTPVSDVVATIEARKKTKPTSTPTNRPNRPRKKMLYDDFGEPLRWIWIDQ
jgi:hypothetical protein